MTFRAKGSTFSVPVEISTGVRLLYFLSVYGGIGFDFRNGETDGSGTGGTQINAGPETADVVLNIQQTGEADSGGSKAFGGLQINLSLLKLFLQAQASLNDDLIGASAGARIMW